MSILLLLKFIIIIKFIHISLEVFFNINNIEIVIFFVSFFCFFYLCTVLYQYIVQLKKSVASSVIHPLYVFVHLYWGYLDLLKFYIIHLENKLTLGVQFYLLWFIFLRNCYKDVIYKLVILINTRMFVLRMLKSFLKKYKIVTRLNKKVYNIKFILFS